MATTFMPEVPSAPASAGSGSSSTVLQSSQTGALKIPNFDDAGYDAWVLSRLVKARMANYEANMGKVKQTFWRKALMSSFERMEENEMGHQEETLHWEGKPDKGKKGVSFFMDVPFKHSERTGEVFEGPVSSQLTFEKDKWEDGPVFVNPERAV
jgi:hypothetical protein